MKVEFRQLPARSAKGFSLFELVIAIAIAGFVLTSIFKIADGSVRANSKMVDIQNEEIERDAFFSFLRNHFDSLPGDAIFNLRNTSNSEPYTSELTFQNTPVSFNWGGIPIAAQATRLITFPTVTDGLDVVLEYYDVQILDSDEGPAERGIDPIATVTLLRDVRLFEWTVLDVRNYDNTERDEWPYEWDAPNQRPSYVELTIIFENGDRRVKRLFWIPKKSNPRTNMSALQNSARSARSNSGGAGGQPGSVPGGGGARPGGDRPPGTGSRPAGGSGGTQRPSTGGGPTSGSTPRISR